MIAGDVQVPESVDAVDAAAFDATVARRRSELTRLTLAARTATQRRVRAEAALAAAIGDEGVPSELLAVVDAMLERAARSAEAALDSARREADAVVARAMDESLDRLQRVGLDPAAWPLTPQASSGSSSMPVPPTAAQLWEVVRAEAPARRPVVGATPGSEPVSAPDAVAEATPVVLGGPPSLLADGPLGASTIGEPAVATLLAEPLTDLEAPAAVGEGTGEVYDIFWQEVAGERRVRDRLLRRSPKEGM